MRLRKRENKRDSSYLQL